LEADVAEQLGAGPLAEDGRPQLSGAQVRAFFGLPVPDAPREALGRFITECAAAAPSFRWTPAANLHLTVRFIGSVDRSLVEGIASPLAARHLAAFDLELGDLGTFKRGRLVRVVWLGLRSGAEELRTLASEVDAECSRAGLAVEKRPFQAHLTLARPRVRDGAELPRVPLPPRLEPWRATELVLYASHLSPKGAVYEPLQVLELD
jgi:RNA 2',3'-cyclic 3'-phosphodiesterase